MAVKAAGQGNRRGPDVRKTRLHTEQTPSSRSVRYMKPIRRRNQASGFSPVAADRTDTRFLSSEVKSVEKLGRPLDAQPLHFIGPAHDAIRRLPRARKISNLFTFRLIYPEERFMLRTKLYQPFRQYDERRKWNIRFEDAQRDIQPKCILRGDYRPSITFLAFPKLPGP